MTDLTIFMLVALFIANGLAIGLLGANQSEIEKKISQVKNEIICFNKAVNDGHSRLLSMIQSHTGLIAKLTHNQKKPGKRRLRK